MMTSVKKPIEEKKENIKRLNQELDKFEDDYS
jgi:hypothetical protein